MRNGATHHLKPSADARAQSGSIIWRTSLLCAVTMLLPSQAQSADHKAHADRGSGSEREGDDDDRRHGGDIIVIGTRDDDPVDGVVAHRARTGTRTDTPILLVPQALSVVTETQMEQQGPQSVADALRYTSGVFTDTRNGSVLETVFLRGFGGYATNAINPQLWNGLPMPRGTGRGQPALDPVLLDRVELLHGPASVLYGQASPGGVINMVSKAPAERPTYRVQLGTGNLNRAEGDIDASGPLTSDSTLGYRLITLARRADTQVDFSREQRIVVAPTLRWTRGHRTAVTLYGLYQNDPDNNFAGWLPGNGTVKPAPWGKYPRSFFAGEPGYDGYSRSQYMIGYTAEHSFSHAVTVRQNARLSRIDADFRGVSVNYRNPYGPGNSLNRLASWGKERADQITSDSQLEARIVAGPIEQTVVAGLSYQTSRDIVSASAPTRTAPLDYLVPAYGTPIGFIPAAQRTRQIWHRTGLYLQDQIRWGDLAITAGARHD